VNPVIAAPSLSIRPACADDQAFVAATFAEQLERGRHQKPNAIVDRVLDSDRTRVLVALDGGRIAGWLAYAAIPRVRAVLFLYVRRQYRTGGVARELCDAAWLKPAPWVHGGLRGTSTASLLQRYPATAMELEELL